MEFVDSHCHLQFDDYLPDVEQVIKSVHVYHVAKMICPGVSLADSQKAIEFAKAHDNIWAGVGIHPHEAQNITDIQQASAEMEKLLGANKVVAVGEIGLDYFHENSPRSAQIKLLKAQIEIGLKTGLPFIFHVREAPQQKLEASQSDYRLLRSGFATGQAFEDFWEVVDSYKGIRGVVHSFSAHHKQLDEILNRGFLVGLNGIMTFTKDPAQLEAAKKVPLDRLLLETDAPFLAPKPERGKRCEPKHVVLTAEFLANLRGEPLEKLASATTKNARELFKI